MSKPSATKNTIICFTLCALHDLNQPEVLINGKTSTKKWATFTDYETKLSEKRIKKKAAESEVITEVKMGIINPIAISEQVINAFVLIYESIELLIETTGKIDSSPIDKLVNNPIKINGFNV